MSAVSTAIPKKTDTGTFVPRVETEELISGSEAIAVACKITPHEITIAKRVPVEV